MVGAEGSVNGRAYYNEHDRFAAAWLRELIRDGLIPAGDVDERDIQLVQPADLAGYTACHVFAGIGGWAYALRLAGWPEDRPVWTGSCPCQPFSAAGKGEGFNDSRHLWPTWFRLIRECGPPVVLGEQAASRDGMAWFDHVSADMEAEAYAIGAADLCAASSGAPHIRQRLFFVAYAERGRPEGGRHRPGPSRADLSAKDCITERLAYPGRRGVQLRGGLDVAGAAGGDETASRERERLRAHARTGCDAGLLADTKRDGGGPDVSGAGPERRAAHQRSDPWANTAWVNCTDGKARPTQPGLFPLAHGIPNRVGTLRGAGNAIVPQVAAQFVGAFLEAEARLA